MKIRILALGLMAMLLASSCGKTCRCYAYDGSVDEFDISELEANDEVCEDKENINFGLKYSICERVVF